MKIGLVDPEIAFAHSKKEEINASKIYSPVGNLAEWAKNITIIICKSELRYFNSLWNASLLNEGHFANLAKNRLPWQLPLRNRKKRSGSIKLTHIPHLVKKIVKIGLVGPEIIWLKLKKKKLWKIKCIALLASLPSGQNYMTHSEVHFNSYFTVSTLFLRI